MQFKKLLPLLSAGHVFCAGFFLPTAIVFAVTGGLYTFGIRGSYETKAQTVELPLRADPKLDELVEVAKSVLKDKFSQEQTPSGEAALKKAGTSWQFEWTGSRADFTLEPTQTPGSFKVSLKETGFHRFFVQLHKAKGGWPFKILAGGLATAFLFLFASGVGMAITRPAQAKRLKYSLAAGSLTFLICIFIS